MIRIRMDTHDVRNARPVADLMSLSDGSPHSEEAWLEIKCILHAVVNSLCGLGSGPLVWHMHSVCLLHGHVAHESHSAEELDSRFASEWSTDHLPLS